MTITDLTAQRLDLAGTRAFRAPGAGGPRRETLTTFGRDWLQSGSPVARSRAATTPPPR